MPDQQLLDALLDSWDRNNTILVNLLRALPQSALEIRAMDSSPSIAQMLTHIHYVRLVFIFEDLPDFSPELPTEEWVAESDSGRIELMLNESSVLFRAAMHDAITNGKEMQLHYDHPLLLLQHMIWHEGYHHGQIKLALKLAGCHVADEELGPVTWGVWMDKTRAANREQ